MSTSSALSSYYVDSIMGHDTEDVYGARYVQGSHTARPSGVGENADFSSCSFAPKSAVFPASWTSVHQPSTAAVSGIYHPYVHQTHLSDSRYVRSWIEPVSNHISLSGFHSSSRHSGTKPGGLPSKRTESAAFETETPVVPEFSCSAVSESVNKATAEETVANDISSHSEPKDEKQQQLDPSK